MKELSWEPKRQGKFYCAPGCGRGCTWAEYQSANRRAARLRSKMGNAWRVRVWENLGWHWSLELKVLDGQLTLYSETYPDRRVRYYTLMHNRDLGGRHEWLSKGSFSNPKEAVKHQLELAREFIDNELEHCKKFVDAIDYVLNVKPKIKAKPTIKTRRARRSA